MKHSLALGHLLMISVFAGASAQAQLPQNYVELTAAEKLDVLWKNCNEIPYSQHEILNTQIPNATASGWEKMWLMWPSYLTGAFGNRTCPVVNAAHPDGSWDELPPGRKKLIHPLGAVAKVTWIPSDQTYFTGVFGSGGVGLLRASHAAGPQKSIPGMGLKILIDGLPSVNFHVMYKLEGQPNSWNYFENEFSNVVQPESFKLKILQLPFVAAISSWFMSNGPETAGTLPLEESARITCAGEIEEDIHAPFKMIFAPTDEAKGLMRANDSTDLRVQLMNTENFKPGMILYNIYGVARSSDARIDLGSLRLDSHFVASPYADNTLFFPHQIRLAQ